ncbi:MAG TPA: MFS transporter [Dehalococcoidia bacterium]|nr:MFS transporter [Dehalococcoidia bacterium]
MAGAGAPAHQPSRVFYGWIVVAGGFVYLLLAYGSHWSSGLFFEQLRQSFANDRAVLSGVYSLYIFLYPLINFASGRLVDRFDPRWVLAGGGVCLGIGFALMSQVTAIWQIYVVYATLIALGLGVAFVPVTTVVVKWFVRRRGLAAGLVTAGIGLGTVAIPPIAGALMAALGWRGAYFWMGVGLAVLLALTATVMVREPELRGLRPDGDPTPVSRGAAQVASGEEFSWTVGEATRTPAFWLLTGAYLFHSAVIFVPLVHLVGFARSEIGLEAGPAAAAISVVGIGSLGGRLLTAAASDRLPDQRLVLICLLLQVAAYLGYVVAPNLVILYAATAVYGFSYGGLTGMMPVLVGNFFGRRHAGAIGGVFFATLGCAAGLGPFLAGTIADLAGSYRLAFAVSAAANLVGFVIFLTVRRPDPRRLARYARTAEGIEAAT